jgi:hypothetical protein
MKSLLFAALLLLPSLTQAGVVKIISPDTAQTYSYSDVTWKSLRWDAGRRRLTANITFSTYNYVNHFEPLAEESYVFAFPGVKYDRAAGTFFATNARGEHIPVAKYGWDGIGHAIQPLPGTVIYIVKQSGKVVVALTATDSPGRPDPFQLHWVEDNNGFFLDNLAKAGIAALSH